MSQNNTKSSLFNFETHLVATVIWVFSLAGVNAFSGLIMIIACYYILKKENSSYFLRNHVSQALGLALTSTAISTIFLVFTRVILIKFLIPLYWMISAALGILIFLFALLGAFKAFKFETIKLPIIGFIGDYLNNNITPKQ